MQSRIWWLKFFAWVLYIIPNALSIFWLVQGWSVVGFDIMSFAYVPMNLMYLIGGLYVVRNIDRLLPKYRERLIRALILLFGADTIYASVFAFLAINHPDAFNPPMDASQSLTIQGSLAGFGLSLLILFVVIRLINQASGIKDKKPAQWQTILGWTIIAIVAGAVVWYGLNG